jgi:hypothetical protein
MCDQVTVSQSQIMIFYCTQLLQHFHKRTSTLAMRSNGPLPQVSQEGEEGSNPVMQSSIPTTLSGSQVHKHPKIKIIINLMSPFQGFVHS